MSDVGCRCPRCVRADLALLLRDLTRVVGPVRIARALERPGLRGPFVVRWGWA